MTPVMALDGVTSFIHLKDVTNTCKRMQNSPNFFGIIQYNGGKLEEAEYFKCVFVAYCVFESKQISSSSELFQ